MTGALPSKKWLILPLEIVERELNGKLLICDEAIRRGGRECRNSVTAATDERNWR